MNITDEDNMNPNQFDKVHKAEIQKYKDKHPKCSKEDMLSFAEFSYKRGHKLKSTYKDDFEAWTNAHNK